MGWEGFMQMERQRLRERREGQLRRALGVALPGEEVEQLDRVAELDRRRAEQGLVAVKGREGKISFEPLDDLRPQDIEFRTAADWVEVEWLQKRVQRLHEGGGAAHPEHLR